MAGRTPHEIANALSVTEGGLTSFMRRNFILEIAVRDASPTLLKADYKKQREGPGVRASQWMSRHSDQIPKVTIKKKTDVTEERWAEHQAYDWLKKNHNKLEKMKVFTPKQRAAVSAYFGRSRAGERASQWMSRHSDQIPKSTNKKKADVTEEKWAEHQAYGWLKKNHKKPCLLYTSPSPRDGLLSRMPSSA